MWSINRKPRQRRCTGAKANQNWRKAPTAIHKLCIVPSWQKPQAMDASGNSNIKATVAKLAGSASVAGRAQLLAAVFRGELSLTKDNGGHRDGRNGHWTATRQLANTTRRLNLLSSVSIRKSSNGRDVQYPFGLTRHGQTTFGTVKMLGDGELRQAAKARHVERRWRAASAEFRPAREFASN